MRSADRNSCPTTVARRLIRHVLIAAVEHDTVDIFHLRGENAENGVKFSAQARERNAGAFGDFTHIDAFDRLFGQ